MVAKDYFNLKTDQDVIRSSVEILRIFLNDDLEIINAFIQNWGKGNNYPNFLESQLLWIITSSYEPDQGWINFFFYKTPFQKGRIGQNQNIQLWRQNQAHQGAYGAKRKQQLMSSSSQGPVQESGVLQRSCINRVRQSDTCPSSKERTPHLICCITPWEHA